MNDKELLEMAAKAAGIQICNTWLSDEGRAWSSIWAKDFNGAPTTKLWNPLGNDGDAFRLIVELKLELTVFRDHVTAFHATSWCDELHGDEPFAATRRAIVRAAAEVGNLKP